MHETVAWLTRSLDLDREAGQPHLPHGTSFKLAIKT